MMIFSTEQTSSLHFLKPQHDQKQCRMDKQISMKSNADKITDFH